jgi:Polyketide cyclase / dehydrase and lipid transport
VGRSIARVPSIDTVVETTLPPDQVRAALLDFSERRLEIWPGIAPSLYEVYTAEETSAEIKEGTRLPFGEVWARERYDWSEPNTIRWTVIDSNFSTPGSFVSATLEPKDGGTHVKIHWEREGTSLFHKLMMRMMVPTKGKPIAQSFQNGLRKLETQR